ncbi:hypothetical protein KP509_37G039200 [Ceratopteris richardii]|uniref:Glycosyltransferase n=4 Tax=Ceratopteris richardii TaxID=49495 RepID=A0A8T2Q981_CERRI|nr:hypothetical protein KP509_37G039200 [Ceratopteris richardii]
MSAMEPHVMVVPLPIQGHIGPLTSLAHLLAASGISVVFVRSARAHALLQAASNKTALSVFSASSLSFSPDLVNSTSRATIHIEIVADGLPTDPKQWLERDTVRGSFNTIGKGVEELLQKRMVEKQLPKCLILDSFFSSLGQRLAVKFRLPWMAFWASSASVFSLAYHIPELVAKGYVPAKEEGAMDREIDFIPGLSPIAVRDLPKGFDVGLDPQNNSRLLLVCNILENAKQADRILVNSFFELESAVVQSLREAGLHLDMVGPLFMMHSLSSLSSHATAAASLLPEDTSCLTWLDKQQETSVLYVAFGSMSPMEEHTLTDLAHALEASNVNFLWVIRPDCMSGKASLQQLLPKGFMERTQNRGCVVSWAPQLAVLGHRSIGAFLTHCGWNSVLESLSHGVPILGFPQAAEQNTNLRFVVEDWKVGLSLFSEKQQKESCNRSSMCSQAEHTIAEIMRGERGTEARKHALEWKKIAMEACTSGSSLLNLQRVANELITGHLA